MKQMPHGERLERLADLVVSAPVIVLLVVIGVRRVVRRRLKLDPGRPAAWGTFSGVR